MTCVKHSDRYLKGSIILTVTIILRETLLTFPFLRLRKLSLTELINFPNSQTQQSYFRDCALRMQWDTICKAVVVVITVVIIEPGKYDKIGNYFSYTLVTIIQGFSSLGTGVLGPSLYFPACLV